jgi:hypothetical protein
MRALVKLALKAQASKPLEGVSTPPPVADHVFAIPLKLRHFEVYESV